MRRIWICSVFSMLLAATSVFAAPITQLGFAVDGSGSISSSNFNSMKLSLTNAIGLAVPTNSTVEITVVQFSSGSSLVVAPTLIDSLATLQNVQTAISGMAQLNGTTNTAGAISTLTTQITGSSNFGTPGSFQVLNILTDGNPNSQADAVAAANAAIAAGIDEIDLEAIGSSVNLNNMLALARPGPGHLTTSPDGFSPGFVVPVGSFGTELDDAIAAKLRAVLEERNEVPEPTSFAVFGMLTAAGAYYGLRRKANEQKAAA